MKTIYFVRHGESEANLEDIAAGAEFDTPLSDNGRVQAKQTGKDLKDRKVDLIVSSPMKRAFETAEIIAKEIDYDPKKIVTKPFLVERGLGVYSKRPLSEFTKAVSRDDLHESVEAVEELVRRVAAGLEWVVKQKADRILLVSHSDVSAALRLIHQKLPHTHLYKIKEHENASIYKFTLE